ncbi:type IX secretion system protein PorQ [soil metagenome]
MRKLSGCCFLFILLLSSDALFAQIGGSNTYAFLNLVAPARSAALGGNAIATRADDVSLVAQNPSQLTTEMHQQLSLSYVGYLAGIKFGDVAYAYDFKKIGMFSGNLKFVNYGSFDRTDVNSEVIGTFKAAEYALSFSWSKALDSSLFIGAAFKGIYSNLGDYKSSGVAADVALTWYDQENLWCATIVAKNIGAQISTYEGGDQEKLPFELQAGISKKLDKAPFRFSLIAQQLQKFDLTYEDPNLTGVDPLTGESKAEKITFTNKVARHLILNAEILFSKNFNARLGYNFMRRKELAYTEAKGMSGMSIGFGLNIKKFSFSYARSIYNKAGGSNHFSIATNLSNF